MENPDLRDRQVQLACLDYKVSAVKLVKLDLKVIVALKDLKEFQVKTVAKEIKASKEIRVNLEVQD